MSPSRIRRHIIRDRRARTRAILYPWRTGPLADAIARALWLRFIVAVEGTPVEIFRRHWVRGDEHRQLRNFVQHLETFVRRIVHALALTLMATLKAPPKPPQTRAHRPRKRRLRIMWPEKPSGWIARFPMRAARLSRALTLHDRLRIPQSPCGGEVLPLARRLEAIRRVLENPLKRAQRFAHALRRHNARNNRLWRLPPYIRPHYRYSSWRLTGEKAAVLDVAIARGVWLPQQPG